MKDPPAGRPLVLFDGVCNLCNAAVVWLIERDPEGRLRFASLQSEAARQALRAAGGPDVADAPDSIAFIDGDGVHFHSTAALRIARRLGLPYALLWGAMVLPRPVRDGVYRYVARHRYRWFGRRDVCMRPTRDLADRFLDADEAPPPQSVAALPGEADAWTGIGPAGAGGAATKWTTAWLTRLVVAYFILYMLPFPLSLLGYLPGVPFLGDVPGLAAAVGWIVGLHGLVMNPLVTWVGGSIFGVEATPAFTGSGDTTFNYVHLAVTAGLAVVVASVWTVLARGRAISLRAFDASRVMARYYLATTLLTYGWVKCFPLQFPVPGPDRLIQPYGDSSPMGLAWTFLGASAAYQIFGGLSELVGGYLLFWRRTALVGALAAFAVMANVVAINFFYDVPVKLFSSHLVLVSLFIAAPDIPRIVGFLGFNLPVAPRADRPFWGSWTHRRHAVAALHVLFVVALTGVHVSNNLQAARTYGFLMEPSPLTGVYRVESFRQDGLDDRDVGDEDRWVRVGLTAPNAATVQRASGDATRMRMLLDEQASTVSFYDRGAQPPATPDFTFQFVEPGVVRLEGTFAGKATTVVMRLAETGSLLMERGFHWINEYPFNR